MPCCCTGAPPGECPHACCDPEEALPTFQPNPTNPSQWVRVNRTVDLDCCCVQETFNYVPTAPVFSCCDLLGFYEYLQSYEREDFGWKKWPWLVQQQTQCCPPVCPDNDDCCIPDPPIKISEWQDTYRDRLNYYFPTEFFLDSMKVIWGRELITCPGDTEPQCRYFLKTITNGHFNARVTTERITNWKRELIFLHPCWDYTGTPRPGYPQARCEFDDTTTRCSFPAESCDIDDDRPQECKDLDETDNQPPGCWVEGGGFCFERIKFFTSAIPAGTVTFTDADIWDNTSAFCSHPVCDSPCDDGYISDVEVQSPKGVEPPKWYTYPPIVASTTTNYLLDWDFCAASQGGISSCCPGDEAFPCVAICPPADCVAPTISINVTCAQLNRPPEWLNTNPLVCELKTWYINGDEDQGADDLIGSLIVDNAQGCLFLEDPSVGAIQWPFSHCIAPKPVTAENPCEPSDCYQGWSCGGCFCDCLPLFPAYVAASSNKIAVQVDGSWTDRSCVYSSPNIPIGVSY